MEKLPELRGGGVGRYQVRGGGGAGRNSSFVACSFPSPPRCRRLPQPSPARKQTGNWDAQESSAGSADAAVPEGSAVSFCGDHGRGCDWKLLEMAATAAKRLNTGYSTYYFRRAGGRICGDEPGKIGLKTEAGYLSPEFAAANSWPGLYRDAGRVAAYRSAW